MKRHCSDCGHWHGQQHDDRLTWLRCTATVDTEQGGVARCNCSHE